MNVRRGKVSGRGEVPGVGADLDGEGGTVTKVENHGLRSVHPATRLNLSVLYGRHRLSDGPENRLQFVLGAGWADYLGVFSATGVLAVHPGSLGFLRTTSTFRHSASYPCLAESLTSWDILAPVERIHRRFIAPRYHRGCPAATPRGLQGESCSTTAGFVKRPVKRVASGRRKTEAAVEASLGSLDHKCTSVHLAPGG